MEEKIVLFLSLLWVNLGWIKMKAGIQLTNKFGHEYLNIHINSAYKTLVDGSEYMETC